MERETFELQCSDSICPPPEMQLLGYVKSNHVPKIKSLVDENPEVLNPTMGQLESARDYISENLNHNVENLPGNNNETSNPLDILFGFLEKDNEDDFISCKYLEDYVDADDGVTTLLQMASERGLTRAVECLLNNGADPNLTKSRRSPIETAVIVGHHKIVDLLLRHKRIIVDSGILIELLKQIDDQIIHEDVNHELCYSHLMKHKQKINMNTFDEYNSTPLYYAARYGGTEKTLNLLRAGGSLACKNKYGALPIEDIDANTLETHLNECLETDVETNTDKENFMVIFNYRTLMPPRRQEEHLNKDVVDAEAANKLLANEIEQLASETQVILYMSKSLELKHLLKHPVITSFLYVKWHRIRWFFYTNLAFYIVFCLSLILYILLIYNNRNNQHTSAVYILSILSYLTSTLLLIRELFQFAVSPKTYLLSLENWLELVLLILTAAILSQNSADDAIKPVAAFVILLAAFELVILIGQHPKMSTNIEMLRTVSGNFFKFLLWYSILILAFALSFYTLFNNNLNSENASKAENDTENDEPDFFVDPGISLFKTIVMLTGEFDAGSINFQMYPITSHIIFMLVVFIIAIILFNLLNGLAVNDTQLIKSNAELLGHIARIEHIAYIESMFLGDILPRSFTIFLQRYCCCLLINVTQRFRFIPGILVKRVCLFPYFLNDYRMMVYPNQHARVVLTNAGYSDSEVDSCIITKCTNIYLDKQTAKCTKQLVKTKKELLERERNERSLLEKQNIVIEQQQKDIDELRKEQQVILKKLDYIIKYMHK